MHSAMARLRSDADCDENGRITAEDASGVPVDAHAVRDSDRPRPIGKPSLSNGVANDACPSNSD